MSSYIMHICISNIVKNKYNLSSKYMYGSVLPDLKKNMGCDRTSTHFTEKVETKGGIRDLPQIDKAILELKDKMNFEVYLGYISHLIEDYIWFNKYIPEYTKKLNENEVLYLKNNSIHSLDEYRNDVYSDYRYFAKYIVDKCEMNLTQTLKDISHYLNEEETKILIQNTSINTEAPSSAILISTESIDKYIQECVSEVDKIVNNMLNNKDKIECISC